MSMAPEDFQLISELLKQRSGLSITKEKMYLIESRLQPIARSHGYADLSDFIRRALRPANPDIEHEVVQAMTTNETMFFRDLKPFTQLRERIIPHWRAQHPARQKLRIWSAACSSGQEPYTIAMSLKEETAALSGCDIDIVASDLSEKVVEKAIKGVYSQFEVQRGLPIQMLIKYFEQGEENCWRVKDTIKRMVHFQSHNLLHDATRFGTFDIIFCRNVLIYFDTETKLAVLNRLAGMLNPPGFLVLGSAETVFGLDSPFEPYENESGVYVLKQS